jgi:hypothetical protein
MHTKYTICLYIFTPLPPSKNLRSFPGPACPLPKIRTYICIYICIYIRDMRITLYTNRKQYLYMKIVMYVCVKISDPFQGLHGPYRKCAPKYEYIYIYKTYENHIVYKLKAIYVYEDNYIYIYIVFSWACMALSINTHLYICIYINIHKNKRIYNKAVGYYSLYLIQR